MVQWLPWESLPGGRQYDPRLASLLPRYRSCGTMELEWAKRPRLPQGG